MGLGCVALCCLAVLAGCGGGGDQDPTVLPAGQVDIKLPAGYEVVDGKVVKPAGAGTGGSASGGRASVTTTIPLDEDEDPTTALFDAVAKFRGCLDGLGVKFIGAPDSANPDSPTNDRDYVSALGTCAARSNVVQALQAAQSANDNLTPEEIQERNKAYLKWRKCMIGRGWKIAEPVPDEKGRLFSFGASTSSQIQAPPGKDILSSDDTRECAERSRRQLQNGSGR
ncbi:MAG: hypothetical protein FJW95_01360 [Actinobacteria bacterium]|nr:hypothetical protein [Actinomycetota bacterium]